MRIQKILILIAAILAGYISAGEIPDLLNGHFVSNREETVTQWRKTKPFGDQTPEIIEKLGPALGAMEMIIEGENYRAVSGDWVEEGKAEFIFVEGNTLHVKVYSTVWKRDVISVIHVDEEGYWIHTDFPMKGYCERFTRKPPKK